ncbi:MAG: hypothetical protein P1U63_10900 [Coxiellaceae bacterium]|nr:hypothetical protein [Coxiellaceae bacterium]
MSRENPSIFTSIAPDAVAMECAQNLVNRWYAEFEPEEIEIDPVQMDEVFIEIVAFQEELAQLAAQGAELKEKIVLILTVLEQYLEETGDIVRFPVVSRQLRGIEPPEFDLSARV